MVGAAFRWFRIAVPLILYPPGYDTNGFDIFKAPMTWNPMDSDANTSSIALASASPMDREITPDGVPGSSGTGQDSRAPVRPPNKPVMGRAGYFGVAYDTYGANGSNGFVLSPPNNSYPFGPISLEGHTAATSTFGYPPLPGYTREAQNFFAQMCGANWMPAFIKANNAFSISDLRASGGNIFNNADVGLLLLHGTYGTAMDYTEGGAEEIYFPITSGTGAQYLRMSEISLGSSATHGLKWMAILACNSLRQSQWNSMQNANVSPINGNLHLIFGANSVIWTGDHVASYWAKYMTVGKNFGSPMTIRAAYYAGAHDAYTETEFNYTNAMFLTVAGDAACKDDLLQNNSSPTGTKFYDTSTQVWP